MEHYYFYILDHEAHTSVTQVSYCPHCSKLISEGRFSLLLYKKRALTEGGDILLGAIALQCPDCEDPQYGAYQYFATRGDALVRQEEITLFLQSRVAIPLQPIKEVRTN